MRVSQVSWHNVFDEEVVRELEGPHLVELLLESGLDAVLSLLQNWWSGQCG